MATTTIKNVKYTNIPNKKQGIVIGDRLTQANVKISDTSSGYIQSDRFYNLVNGIDIDWNGIEIDNNTIINDTSDLINLILSLKNEIKNLKVRINKLENSESSDDEETGDDDEVQSLNTIYNGSGETQLYNP